MRFRYPTIDGKPAYKQGVWVSIDGRFIVGRMGSRDWRVWVAKPQDSEWFVGTGLVNCRFVSRTEAAEALELAVSLAEAA